MTRVPVLLFTLSALFVAPAHATEAGWALLRQGGHVVLLRHGYAVGGQPVIAGPAEECRTGRGLTDRGLQQVRRIGALFLARAEAVDQVYTSQSCAARQTAELAFRDSEIASLPLLDEPASESAGASAASEIRTLVGNYNGSGNLVLVTNEATIRALTGQAAREGEALIVRPDGDKLHVAARVIFN